MYSTITTGRSTTVVRATVVGTTVVRIYSTITTGRSTTVVRATVVGTTVVRVFNTGRSTTVVRTTVVRIYSTITTGRVTKGSSTVVRVYHNSIRLHSNIKKESDFFHIIIIIMGL
jgi:hypothetical protein